MLSAHLIARTRPVARPENIVRFGAVRVTVLADRLFRLEYDPSETFCDSATQAVWYRDMPPQTFSTHIERNALVVVTPAVTLTVPRGLRGCTVDFGAGPIPVSNRGNLGGTSRTLDQARGDRYIYGDLIGKRIPVTDGVASKTGVAVYDDSATLLLDENGEVRARFAAAEGKHDVTFPGFCLGPEKKRATPTKDLYVFAYGSDYRGAVRALYTITGLPPMLPRFALGNWWSRYHAYTADEYLTQMDSFARRDIPFTVATVDMDWHWSTTLDERKHITEQGKNTDFYGGAYGWTGYSWNTDLFPDHKAFLKALHARNLHVTLNLHPALGVRWFEDAYEDMARAVGIDPSTGAQVPFRIADPAFVNAYFALLHKPYEREGVDFWWIDWQQGTRSELEGLDPLWALNHYHTLDNAVGHECPLILSRFAGVGSHRYPVGFTGDTTIDWETLDYLPYFTARASNVGYTWWSHDIGGHMRGETSGELYARFVQFGVFSPVLRLHCSDSIVITKDPAAYAGGAGLVAEAYLRLRHRLIPYLYTAAHRTATQGIALCEPLCYEWDDPHAYECKNEYLFGGEMIVAPVTHRADRSGYARIKGWLPAGRWTDFFDGTVYEGGRSYEWLRDLERVPVFLREGAIVPLDGRTSGNAADVPDALELHVCNGSGAYTLFEAKNGKSAYTVFETVGGESEQTLTAHCSDEGDVVPADRVLTVRFRNIPEGRVTVTADGAPIEAERLYDDCASVRFPLRRGVTYAVHAAFRPQTELERLLAYARRILTSAEEDNIEKHCFWYDTLSAVDSVKAYRDAVETAPLKAVTKKRLSELFGI